MTEQRDRQRERQAEAAADLEVRPEVIEDLDDPKEATAQFCVVPFCFHLPGAAAEEMMNIPCAVPPDM
jgi:hypothetical protein